MYFPLYFHYWVETAMSSTCWSLWAPVHYVTSFPFGNSPYSVTILPFPVTYLSMWISMYAGPHHVPLHVQTCNGYYILVHVDICAGRSISLSGLVITQHVCNYNCNSYLLLLLCLVQFYLTLMGA